MWCKSEFQSGVAGIHNTQLTAIKLLVVYAIADRENRHTAAI